MTHADLHRIPPDEPVWGLVAQMAAHHYSGEVVVGTHPSVRMWALDGAVYHAEREGDPSIATRLEQEGLVTRAQLQQGAVLVGEHLSLARLFSRRPDVDRDAVELEVGLAAEAVLAEVASQPVGAVQWAPLRHHPSGVHLWRVVPGPAAPTASLAPTAVTPPAVTSPPAVPVVDTPAPAAVTAPAVPRLAAAPTPVVAPPVVTSTVVPPTVDAPPVVAPPVVAPPVVTPTVDAPTGAPPSVPTPAPAGREELDLPGMPALGDLPDLGDFDLEAVRAAILATPPPTLDPIPAVATVSTPSTDAPAHRAVVEQEVRAVWEMVDRLDEVAPAATPAPAPSRWRWRRATPGATVEPSPAKPPRPAKQPKAPKPAKPAKEPKPAQRPERPRPAKPAKPAKPPKPAKKAAPPESVQDTTPATTSGPVKEPKPAKEPKPVKPPKPRKVKAKKQPVIIPNKPKPTKGRHRADPAPDAQPNGGTS